MDAGNILVMVLIAATLALLIAGEVHCRRNTARIERKEPRDQSLPELPGNKDSDAASQRKQAA